MRRVLIASTALLPLALLACVPVLPARAEAPFAFESAPGQLPKTAVPRAYDIALTTDVAHLTFSGAETVTLELRAPSASITLNQAGLKIAKAVLDDGTPATVTQDDARQTATLHFARALAAGAHRLAISYSGPILKTPNGLYADDYKGPDGQTHRMLVTQFEVADARRMFPGWDEPAFKATFRLTVTLPSTFTAVANMPIAASTELGDGRKRVSFQTTPRMSSYLLALVAGDIDAVRGNAAGVALATYAPSGQQAQGRAALADAEAILPYYNDYFGVRYPLPKMDMLAIPGNYEAGAMENWGALTYIDSALLFDPDTSGPQSREYIHLVVAHEMAHQWSGDLVTMGWWNDIWLNEGFATWMELKATDHLNPQWDTWPRQHDEREKTLGADALAGTHPIQQQIRDVSEADSAFDAISYGKGGLVIRMIEGWLGEDRFRDGMRAYMKAHAYSNTSSQDLWNALSGVSGQDVGTVARSFTEQPGIPLLDVTSSCRGGKGVYTLTQSRFSIHDPDARPLRWTIPVVAGGPGLQTSRLVLSGATATLEAPSCDAPLKLDLGETGYYRVRYDAHAFAALKGAFARFAPVDRANLFGDQYALFQSGQAPLSHYLDLAAALPGQNERDIAVIEEVTTRLTALDADESGAADRAAFRRFARSVLAPTLARLGWDAKPGESPLDTTLRPEIIEALGRFDDPAVVAEAKRRFDAWQRDPEALSPALQGAVAGLAARRADAQTWQALAAKVQGAQATDEKLRLMGAIAHADDPDLVARNVQLAYGGAIPNGRIVRVLTTIANASERPELVWKLVKQHEAEIRTHLAPWSQDKLLPAIATSAHDAATAQALRTDPAATRTSGGCIATAHALDAIGARIEIRQRAQAQLTAWLAARH